MVPLDQLEGERIPVLRFLGPAATAAVSEGIEHAEGSQCFEPPRVDERNWRITRRQGHWAAEGWAETHRTCGYGVDFAINLPLPESVVGYDRLPGGWDALNSSFWHIASITGDWGASSSANVEPAPTRLTRRPERFAHGDGAMGDRPQRGLLDPRATEKLLMFA